MLKKTDLRYMETGSNVMGPKDDAMGTETGAIVTGKHSISIASRTVSM